MPQEQDKPVQDTHLYQAFRAMKQKDFASAESLLNKGLGQARQKGDVKNEGLYLATFGVLHKLKKDYKKAYKFYQQAEKILKDDASIKIISSLLLIEQFKQFDIAIRKLEKVIQTSLDPAILHHAKAIQGMAYFLAGKQDKALANFDLMLKQDFAFLRFAANLDFKLVELFTKKHTFPDRCLEYLKKALALAKQKNEKPYIFVIENLIKGLSSLVNNSSG